MPQKTQRFSGEWAGIYCGIEMLKDRVEYLMRTQGIVEVHKDEA